MNKQTNKQAVGANTDHLRNYEMLKVGPHHGPRNYELFKGNRHHVVMLPAGSSNVYTYLAGQPFRSTKPCLTNPDMDDQAV